MPQTDDDHPPPPPSFQTGVDNSADQPRPERRNPPPVQEVRLRQETLDHLEEKIAQAVRKGIKGAANEETAAAFWGAGIDLLRKQATERAGQAVIGGLWGLMQRVMLFLFLGGLVYSVGGWSALAALFKTVFGGQS